MAWARLQTATFGIVAILLVASGIAISELPGACGQVGRPNLDLFARLALLTGGGFWMVGAVATAQGQRRTTLPRRLVAVAFIELAVGVGLALYYRHHVGWYDRCG